MQDCSVAQLLNCSMYRITIILILSILAWSNTVGQEGRATGKPESEQESRGAEVLPFSPSGLPASNYRLGPDDVISISLDST